MLQIISGKFYEDSASIVSDDGQGLTFSNFNFGAPIETCVATLEPLETNRMMSVSAYLITFKNKIDERVEVRKCGDAEIIRQFQNLCIFGLKAFFDNDKSFVKLNCRQYSESSADEFVPFQFVSRYFHLPVLGIPEEIDNFKDFIDKVIGLPREIYLAVVDSINAFVNALKVLNYDIDLAYSLIIYSLESLSQKFDSYEPTWEDYDRKIKKKLDQCFDDNSLDNTICEDIQGILLESSNLKLQKRFKTFSSKYLNDDFFKDEAKGIKKPLRKSELEQVLTNSYKMRSNYVHTLKKIEEYARDPKLADGEVIYDWNNSPYLTFRGLIRLTHHVIYSYITSQKYLENEDYPWVDDLPCIMKMKWHPKYWMGDPTHFKPENGLYVFSKFLNVFLENVEFHEPRVDLRKIHKKIEQLMKGGVKKQYKASLVAFYYLDNFFADSSYRSSKYGNFIKKHFNILENECSIESIITFTILDRKFPYNIDDVDSCYLDYNKRKFRKSSISIPNSLELYIMTRIANEYLKIGDLINYKKWLNIAILEIPGKIACQRLIEDYLSNEEEIDLDKVLRYYKTTAI